MVFENNDTGGIGDLVFEKNGARGSRDLVFEKNVEKILHRENSKCWVMKA